MDLGGFEYVEDLYDPVEVVILVLLLSLVPLVAAAVVTVLRRPGFKLAGWPQCRLVRIPLVRRFARLAILVVVGLSMLIALSVDRLVLEELLELPGGGWIVLTAIVLGIVLGMLAATRPRSRMLTGASIAMAFVVVLVAVVFSSQFVAPAAGGGYERDVTPGTTGTKPAPARVYEPTLLRLPQGTFSSSEICIDGHGDMPVSLEVIAGAIVEATRSDGTLVRVGDVRELRPCTQPDGGDELHRAPGATLQTFDGEKLPLTATSPVALIATYVDDSGESMAWVWRRVQGVMYTGVLRADLLRG